MLIKYCATVNTPIFFPFDVVNNLEILFIYAVVGIDFARILTSRMDASFKSFARILTSRMDASTYTKISSREQRPISLDFLKMNHVVKFRKF